MLKFFTPLILILVILVPPYILWSHGILPKLWPAGQALADEDVLSYLEVTLSYLGFGFIFFGGWTAYREIKIAQQTRELQAMTGALDNIYGDIDRLTRQFVWYHQKALRSLFERSISSTLAAGNVKGNWDDLNAGVHNELDKHVQLLAASTEETLTFQQHIEPLLKKIGDLAVLVTRGNYLPREPFASVLLRNELFLWRNTFRRYIRYRQALSLRRSGVGKTPIPYCSDLMKLVARLEHPYTWRFRT